MSDTQWPRFEVFKQDRPGQPHRNVGSVHAPDAEVAWQNARDVFARRPQCHSLWVAPETAIGTLPATNTSAGDSSNSLQDGATTYTVFAKQSDRQSMTYVDYVGELSAVSLEDALARAADVYADVDALVWWACRDDDISRGDFEDSADLLEPAQTKLFRMPNQYHTVFSMQKLKRGDGDDE